MKFGAGQPVRRTEDVRFVTGHGQYTDDMRFDRQAFAAFTRSPYAHAKVVSIDVSGAQAAPGVVAVLTQADVAAMGAKDMIDDLPLKGRGGALPKSVPKPLLARDHVTFAGEAVAMVIAETYAQACDAAEMVVVEYEELPAVGTLGAAQGPRAIWDSIPGNECFEWVGGNEAQTDAAFSAAAHIAGVEVVQNRIVVNSMETRNAIGLYDAATDRYILYSGSQGAGDLRRRAANVAGLKAEQLRVVTQDVGGGFGMKLGVYPEQPLVLLAAKVTGRPVRWSSDRTEAFLADQHGRDMRTRADIALDKEGQFLACG